MTYRVNGIQLRSEAERRRLLTVANAELLRVTSILARQRRELVIATILSSAVSFTAGYFLAYWLL